jgi:hypothetical protein
LLRRPIYIFVKKTNIHIWSYIAQFFLDWKMFMAKVVEKIKTHILCSGTSFRNLCPLWDNTEKYGRSTQTNYCNIIQSMHIACCISKATETHSEYVTFIAFPRQQWLRECASLLRLYVNCLSCLSLSQVVLNECYYLVCPDCTQLLQNVFVSSLLWQIIIYCISVLHVCEPL